MNYFIAVEVSADRPTSEISKALKQAFDGGADGHYKIISTTPAYMVIFQRSREDDYEYLSTRMEQGSSLTTAALRQLADELEEGGIGPEAAPIVELLRKGGAYCFDFDGFF